MRPHPLAVGLFVLLPVVASACGDGGGDGGTAQGAELADVCQEQDGSDLRVGFGNLGESVPFAVSVREGIEKVAEACNLEILNADNALDPQKALENARTFAAQDVDGVVEFQVDATAADAICDILGDRPVIAIDIEHPCAAFMGANNSEAGGLAGRGAGELAKDLWNCQIDAIVSFESLAAGQVSIDRLNGAIAGLQDVCPNLEYGNFQDWSPKVADSIITRLDADRTDPGFAKGRNWLTGHPDADQIVALCINDDSCLGFLAAVEEAGRDGEVVFASQGADPSSHDEIRSNKYYAGSTGYFPEKYGEIVVPNIISMIKDGEPLEEPPLYIEHVFISAQNIDEHYPKPE